MSKGTAHRSGAGRQNETKPSGPRRKFEGRENRKTVSVGQFGAPSFRKGLGNHAMTWEFQVRAGDGIAPSRSILALLTSSRGQPILPRRRALPAAHFP